MRALLVIWSMGALALVLAGLFERAGAAAYAPDLHLVALCVLSVHAPRRWVGLQAAILALVRAPWSVTSPVLTLAAFVAIAAAILGLRRALVTRGPLFLAFVGMSAFASFHLLVSAVPGGEPQAFPAIGEIWIQGLLTALLVPVFAALVRSFPVLKGACAARGC